VARDEMRIDRFSPRATSALAQGSDPNGEPAAVPRTAQAARDALTSVVGTLLDLGMPSQEIAAVVAADQPILVHRYLELHGERLTERLADQLQILARLEQTLHRAHLDRSHQTATAGSLCSRDVKEAAPVAALSVVQGEQVGGCEPAFDRAPTNAVRIVNDHPMKRASVWFSSPS
jgi:hypothetical protein